MIRRPPRSTHCISSAASDVYKRQVSTQSTWDSWIKAPRWRGHAMEVGCLPRMVLGYLQPKQYPEIHDLVDGALKKLDVPVTALFSTLGRTAARGLETAY
eukprot:TRINITY_DN18500_c0_g1_i1.p3 TRINITY_DN18500_c0_g1~~TRINITY_DN18500_c0_g1_i1.p3  ORF type:complete len:100 (-),score=38.95 TRINITY_DN18500_c0_g1_i1:170-469(-)